MLWGTMLSHEKSIIRMMFFVQKPRNGASSCNWIYELYIYITLYNHSQKGSYPKLCLGMSGTFSVGISG